MGAGDFIQEALLTIQAIEDSFLAYSQTQSDFRKIWTISFAI